MTDQHKQTCALAMKSIIDVFVEIKFIELVLVVNNLGLCIFKCFAMMNVLGPFVRLNFCSDSSKDLMLAVSFCTPIIETAPPYRPCESNGNCTANSSLCITATEQNSRANIYMSTNGSNEINHNTLVQMIFRNVGTTFDVKVNADSLSARRTTCLFSLQKFRSGCSSP
ncbi:hypothetical protein GQX74_011188 [Glossina fuscipes]|nr:hypothetical protein GQX74_011188 [Glossina fuscipes]